MSKITAGAMSAAYPVGPRHTHRAVGLLSGPGRLLLEALDDRQPPDRARQDQARRRRQQRDEELAAPELLELEEVPQRLDRQRQRIQGAEGGDQGEHVALDRDVLAARPALEQKDESQP